MKIIQRKLRDRFRFSNAFLTVLCAMIAFTGLPAASQVALDPEEYKASLVEGKVPAGMEKIAAAIELSSDYVEVAVAPNGNFTMGTRAGDPDNPNDDDANMLFGHPNPNSGATTLRVDGTDYWNYGGEQIGAFVEGPNTDGGVNSTVWTAGGVQFTQNLQLVEGGSGLLDALGMEYVVENTDTVPHDVGVRVMFDTQLGANDGAPFRLPTVGNVVEELDLSGDQVPDFWQSFDNLANPNLQTQGTLVGLEATKPDRAVWANWGNLNNNPFDFTADVSRSITDSGVAVYWNPVPIQPGQTVRYVSYYGLGDIDLVQGDLSLGLTGPSALTYMQGQYVPNPFTVTLFVSNDQPGAQFTAQNLTAELGLVEGLDLAPGETAVHDLGDLAVGSDTQTSWQVVASGLSTGDLPYSVDVSADNIPSAHIERTVFVPEGDATPTPTEDIPATPTPTPTEDIPATPTPTPYVPPQGQVALHPGFEQGVPLGFGIVQSSIAIGDIDENGLNEIVVGGFDGGLYAYNGDGTPVLEPPVEGLAPGELFHTPDGTPILSSPTLADVDSDRRVDILWGTDGGEVYRLELRLLNDPPIELKRPLRPGLRKPALKLKLAPIPAEDDDPGR